MIIQVGGEIVGAAANAGVLLSTFIVLANYVIRVTLASALRCRCKQKGFAEKIGVPTAANHEPSATIYLFSEYFFYDQILRMAAVCCPAHVSSRSRTTHTHAIAEPEPQNI